MRYLEVGREEKDLNGDGYADLVVGAHRYSNAGTPGAAMIYFGSSAGLVTPAAQVLYPPELDSRFGYSLAIVGDVNADGYSDLVVGAPGHDDAVADTGRAYLFVGKATGVSSTPTIIPSPVLQAGADFGDRGMLAGNSGSVKGIGDADGDGFADVVIGAPWYDGTEVNEGVVFVFRGGLSGLSLSPASTIYNPVPAPNGNFGAVMAAGDLNGDGLGDLVVGIATKLAGDTNAIPRELQVYFGGAAPSLFATSTLVSDPLVKDRVFFGMSIAANVDADGDGISDLFVGSLSESGGPAGIGGLFAFAGNRQGVYDHYSVVWNVESTGVGWAWNAVGARDLNGDSFSDILIAAPSVVAGPDGNGAAYAAYGVGTGSFVVSAAMLNALPVGTSTIGLTALASLGDVNADGYSDFAISSDRRDVFVYMGSAGGVGNPPSLTLEDDTTTVWTTGNGFGTALD